jgi:hypothetical protein
VDHPPLAPSLRPYYFIIRQIQDPNLISWEFPGYTLKFTVGPVIAGDVNGDGEANIQDVVLILRAGVGLDTLTDDQKLAADMAPDTGTDGREVGDGSVDVADAVRILEYTVGLIPEEIWPY